MHEDFIQLGLVDDDDVILDEAALTLAVLDHPDTNDEPYLDVLQAIAERLVERAAEASSADLAPAEQADVLARVIGREFGFEGDQESYDDPANADLIRVIDRRQGLPVSLSILYVAAARRVGWMANVLDVPGHVLVLVGGEVDPVMIDPFRGGERVDPAQLVALLQKNAPGTNPPVRQVAAMPNRAVLVRLLLNQATRAEGAGKGRRALTLYERMTVVAPTYPHGWWERARLELLDADPTAARQSLTAMLEITREPVLRARVTEAIAALPAH
jgi:regulator of sirC expression with transglutaminase-like and TPR domain